MHCSAALGVHEELDGPPLAQDGRAKSPFHRPCPTLDARRREPDGVLEIGLVGGRCRSSKLEHRFHEGNEIGGGSEAHHFELRDGLGQGEVGEVDRHDVNPVA